MINSCLLRIRPVALLALGILLPWRASGATCPTATSVEALRLDLERVEAAYQAEDAEAVRQIVDAIAADVPCLGEPVQPAIAAALHRALGLRAFLDRREPDAKPARLYFAAARNAEPNYTFRPEVVAPDDPVYREYVAVPVGNGRVSEIAAQPPLQIYFDGTPTTRRPAEWPTLYQVLDERDRPIATAYLMPGEAVPGGTPAVPANVDEQVGTKEGSGRSAAGAWVAGGASVALLGTGVGMHIYNYSVFQSGLNACATGIGLVPEFDADACPGEAANFSTWRTSYIADIALMIAGGAALVTTGAVVLLDDRGVVVGWSGRW